VAVSSGTSGLHLAIRALGIGAGDEVITTPFSFIASTNCILFEQAKPVFVDIEPDTWNIDARLIEHAVTPRTKAILPVDVFGSVPDMEAIRSIATRHGLPLIEDSCEALGSRYRGRSAGSLGDVGVFGFYPNKQITTGEGGMVVTNDAGIAEHCRSLRNQGRGGGEKWLAHERLGYNYRLSELNGALGLAQLRRIEAILAERRRVEELYHRFLGDEPRLVFQRIPPEVTLSRFVYVVRLTDEYTQQDRDRILGELAGKGIGCSNYFPPIHRQPFLAETFGSALGAFPHCEALSMRTIALPFHHQLTESDVRYVCSTLQGLL
jgi:perosamine synthetase